MRTDAETVPCSCWECNRGKVLRLPCGLGEYVDCPAANWRERSCAEKLLSTLNNPFRPSVNSYAPDGRGQILNGIRNVIHR